MRESGDTAIAQSADRFRRRCAATLSHYRHEQRRASIRSLAFERDLILFEFAAAVQIPKHLFASRIRNLRFRKLCSALYFPRAIHFDELVNEIQKRRISGCRQCPADAERIDRSAFCKQARNLIFIEIARSEYSDILPANLIQFSAHPSAVFCHVAAIEADSGGLTSHPYDFLHGILHVVSIKQQKRALGKCIEEMRKRVRFVIVSHHPGMRLRAVRINAELLAGENVGAPDASADCRCASREQSSLCAVSTTRAKLYHPPPLRSRHDASRFAGDHGLVSQRGEQMRLHDLRFDNRRGESKHRLAGKNECALGNRPNVAGKSECAQIFEKFRPDVLKEVMRSQVRNFLTVEVDMLEN